MSSPPGIALPESAAPLLCGRAPPLLLPATSPNSSDTIVSLSRPARPVGRTVRPPLAVAVVWRTAGSRTPARVGQRRSLDHLRRRPVRQQPIVVLQTGLRPVIAIQCADMRRSGLRRLILAVDAQQITNRAYVRTAQLQRFFHGLTYLRRSTLPRQQQNVDHRASPFLLALALAQHIPELVVASRPSPLCPALLQRRRAGQRTRLLRQHIQVMLQLEDLLMPFIAALMPSQTPGLMPDLHICRIDPHCYLGAHWQRRRIEVRQD